KQCQCKPNEERRELALKSYAEVKPDFAKQSKNTSIELYKIILNTYLQIPYTGSSVNLLLSLKKGASTLIPP
ncbi:MAG: hypothetical protein UDG28_10175, partial [Prevotellamassilia sp.]|nr:hypothetical protein [Prevotellamassilia sp.]